ncbi:MFS transporter [Clostridium polyendosporum]|uniref:MFS transporter n=1 Tax=Clostridium polyendosporum TaxID=69208 RepID=A0A919RWF9_9CLOT|nr:MFS transporter [Clostridium polyendosporum]GIM27651.1 MFS transporter [Clostridium polyendosporum]
MQNTLNSTYENRWFILFIVVMLTFMACLDSSIVNVALPVMADKLSVSMAVIEWVVTSYLIVISVTILIFGRLGDIKGKTTVFKWGLVLFTIGSLMCGISNTLSILVVSRIIQAIGAAASMANNQGIITHVFPSNERGRALGVSATFVALGTLVGPPLGGFIVSILSWQYIFLINIPIGILIFVLGIKVLPRASVKEEESLDLKGAILFILTIVLLFGAIIKGREIGYTNLFIIAAFILSVVSLLAFLFFESRIEEPLLELSIFKNRLFSVSIFCAFISFVAISCSNIIQPFYLQDVMKLSPATTGFIMMVYPLVLSIVAPISGYLSDKIGSELLTFIGLVFTIIGLLLVATLNENSDLRVMMVFFAIMSVGNGLFQSPNNSLVMSTVPKNKLGIAGSINALVRNLGMVLGVTLATTLLYNRMSYKIGYRVVNFVEGREDVFIFGMRYVYLIAAAICAVGAILTALRLYSKKRKNIL